MKQQLTLIISGIAIGAILTSATWVFVLITKHQTAVTQDTTLGRYKCVSLRTDSNVILCQPKGFKVNDTILRKAFVIKEVLSN